MSSEASEKTEQPSEHKLRESRKKGQVAKSPDLAALASLCGVLLMVMIFSTFFFEKIRATFQTLLRRDLNAIDLVVVKGNAKNALDAWMMLSLPVLFAAGLGAMIGNVGQFGFLFSTDPIKFDLKKVDPIAGVKKLFSKNRLFEVIKQIIKFLVVFWVIYAAVKDALPNLTLLFRVDLSMSLGIIGELVKSIFVRVVLCFLVIGVADFFWQRFSFLKSMRMSKYEVKKEYIQQEGDPEIKHERRRIQQETLEELSTGNVSEASVVITNPSHVAVALRYKGYEDAVPKIISKGVGRNAKTIIGEAQRLNIPILRNVPLARDLQWLEINEEIPERLYDSVAEVLTFIQELNIKNAEASS